MESYLEFHTHSAARRRRQRRRLATVLAVTIDDMDIRERGANRARVMMDWEERKASLTTEEFTRRYRLNLPAFEDVCHRITHESGIHMATDVPVELKLSMTLRFLAGASYLDIVDLHGVAACTFWKYLHLTIDAINLVYTLPLLPILESGQLSQLEAAAEAYDERTAGVMAGCIGAIDGCAIKICRPRGVHPAQYYCRKGFYSVNLQLVCDSARRVTWMSVLATGSTHDSSALAMSHLGEILADPSHPLAGTNYWLAGDDAYRGNANLSNNILTP
jgi:hypothetical protein